MAASQQRFGDPLEFGGVLHAGGHEGAVEIGSQSNVGGAGERYRMLDVFDDFFRGNLGQLFSPRKSVTQALPFGDLARLVLSEFFLDCFKVGAPFGSRRLRCVRILLAQERVMKSNMDDSAMYRESVD